ncbi:MAG TPA: succinate dehydrogenase, hydrophobic membrane anchor protein [Pseudomonadales bacterium]|jgi:succinate dehydrogenase / fumarate reductase membrane anchor subunit|nr:succinate dehydrogenase, hydrophobic membrane anchor protein [Pseudomonadales bacterium]HNN86545.1 succinate dehydrogenase, hydrophobic membrane anchor protein [Pseudomonadales bacterium]
MVRAVTSFGRSGLSDFLLQRVSGVVIAVYFFFVVGWLLTHRGVDYSTWLSLHQLTSMRIFNTAALLSVVAHAWIGIWVVLTDYVTVRLLGAKATALRLSLEIIAIGVLIAYTLWGLAIVWRV